MGATMWLRCTGNEYHRERPVGKDMIKAERIIVLNKAERRIYQFQSGNLRELRGEVTFNDGDAHLETTGRPNEPLFTHLIHIDIGAGDYWEAQHSDLSTTSSYTLSATCRPMKPLRPG